MDLRRRSAFQIHYLISEITVRLLTHVLCKPTHFFFHSLIATMSYSFQTLKGCPPLSLPRPSTSIKHFASLLADLLYLIFFYIVNF